MYVEKLERSMLGGIKPMEPCVSQRNASMCRFSKSEVIWCTDID